MEINKMEKKMEMRNCSCKEVENEHILKLLLG